MVGGDAVKGSKRKGETSYPKQHRLNPILTAN